MTYQPNFILTGAEVCLRIEAKVVLGCLKVSLEFLQEIPWVRAVGENGLNVFFQGGESSNEVANRHS